MKNIFVFLLPALTLGAYSANAQQSKALTTKWQQKMEETKKHREEVLKKAQEQSQQQQAEKKADVSSQPGSSNNLNSQTNNGTTIPFPSQNQQPQNKGQLLKQVNKKQGTNQ